MGSRRDAGESLEVLKEHTANPQAATELGMDIPRTQALEWRWLPGQMSESVVLWDLRILANCGRSQTINS
jgi:hypothetical protein